MTPSQWIDLGLKLVEVFVLPLLALVITRYVQDARVKAALEVVNEQSLLAVQRLNRTRRELKDPSKPGSWTPEEATSLREAAVSEVIKALGDSFQLLVDRYRSDARARIMVARAVDAHAEGTREAAAAPAAPAAAPDAHAPTLPPPPPAEAPAAPAAPAGEAG